ncbi:MAG: sulfite exporter TauE/SafE family protein [Candidatus Omnitrophica bacterium]|nr:sulfite exporter TauE/SafE family protein [Candidatus Omnitrophota bacterium]
MTIPIWLPLTFFLVALVYSMMGFGGGSSYLAFLVLAGLPYQNVPTLALICNLIVTCGGLWHFYRAGHLKLRKVLPFLVFSIPMAYFGGRILIGKNLFSLLFGFSLFVVALRMFLPDRLFERSREVSSLRVWIIGLPIGGILGFLSGLVGIGGGIFLSPLLLFMRWVNVKEAAAAASLFIVVNSFSGLLGQLHKGVASMSLIVPLGLAVFLGGQIGSRLGAYRLPQLGLQRMLAGLILYVSMKLILGV